MFVLRHLRQHCVAYVALFFALAGSATAAGTVLMKGDPAGGDLSGTYPNPQIAAGGVDSANFFAQGIVTTDLPPIAPSSCVGGFGRVIAGLRASDYAIVSVAAPSPFVWPNGLLLRGGVEPAGDVNAVTFYVCNVTTDEIDPPDGTFRYLVIRQSDA